MSRARQLLCGFYGATAVLALLATWHQNLAYFGPDVGVVPGTVRFWKETFATPASASITLDIFLFGLAATMLMIVEARRLGIRFVWLYLILGFAVAISFSFPLFLIARERRLHALRTEPAVPALAWADVVGLIVFGAPAVVLALWSLLP